MLCDGGLTRSCGLLDGDPERGDSFSGRAVASDTVALSKACTGLCPTDFGSSICIVDAACCGAGDTGGWLDCCTEAGAGVSSPVLAGLAGGVALCAGLVDCALSGMVASRLGSAEKLAGVAKRSSPKPDMRARSGSLGLVESRRSSSSIPVWACWTGTAGAVRVGG